jgi:ribonuclease D
MTGKHTPKPVGRHRRSGSASYDGPGAERSKEASFDYVTTSAELARIIERASQSDAYALDTEFHRERTYYPELALLQLCWRGENSGSALLDPLAIPRDEMISAITALLESKATSIMHACTQDLEILDLLCGVRPQRLFDTQLVAGFLGYSTPSLVSLVQAELGLSLSKSERLTDWLARPLTFAQQQYAIHDVLHLHDLFNRLTAKLESRRRLYWAEDACEDLRTRPATVTNPQDVYKRIREAKGLRGADLGAVRELAAWRETTARALNIPPRKLLPDLAVVGIAQTRNLRADNLSSIRGVRAGQLRGHSKDIVEAVNLGRERPVEYEARNGDNRIPYSKSAVTVINAIVGEVARKHEVDHTLLATREDIERHLCGEVEYLNRGWRGQLLGDTLQAFLDGRVGVTIDPSGGLSIGT